MPTRTIAIPVAEVLNGSKSEFYADLRASLDISRRAANRSLAECQRADAGLWSGVKCPKLYTYPVLKDSFVGVSAAAAAIGRSVEAKYRTSRWRIWKGLQSATSFRSYPWPLLHSEAAKTMQLDFSGEVPLAKMRLIGGWWKVRLAGGTNYREQLRGLRSAIKIGDSKIWTDRKGKAVIGFSVEDAPADDRKKSGVLRVSTHREHLLVAAKERDSVPFAINADIVRQWEAEKNRRSQRLRQDRKRGDRWRKTANAELKRIGGKSNRRIQSLIHQTSRAVVDYAIRRNIAEVLYDGTIKSYCRQFPWYTLASCIAYKCEDAGIVFRDVTQAVSQPDSDKPCIYFAGIFHKGQLLMVKIGRTINWNERRKQYQTLHASDDVVLLAIDNQPKSKLVQKEKYWHSYFDSCRRLGTEETFDGETVLAWLREAGWLGNAGNLSQIAQVLDTERPESSVGRLQAESGSLRGKPHNAVLAKATQTVGDRDCIAAPEVESGH